MDIDRVVIVGAGLAGLTCARELAARGHAPVVLAPACDFDSCWAAMASLTSGSSELDVLEPEGGPFSWAAREARKPNRAAAHRWRYARPRVTTPLGCHVEPGLVMCGDWMQSPRIEGALLSGRLAAQKLAAQA